MLYKKQLFPSGTAKNTHFTLFLHRTSISLTLFLFILDRNIGDKVYDTSAELLMKSHRHTCTFTLVTVLILYNMQCQKSERERLLLAYKRYELEKIIKKIRSFCRSRLICTFFFICFCQNSVLLPYFFKDTKHLYFQIMNFLILQLPLN